MPYWMQELGWIQAVQQMGAFLLLPFKVISFLGTEDFYLILMPFLFWCVDSAIGFRVGLMLLLSNGLNAFAKVAIHHPRPYWVDDSIISYAHETSFGPPSGHAMNSASIWGLIAALLKRKWLTVVSILIIVLVGISRVYLGVHFISDVLLGWLLGVMLLVLFLWAEPRLLKWLRTKSIGQITMLCIASSMGLLVVVALPIWLIGDWQVPDAWRTLATRADAEAPLHPLDITNAFTLAGTWLGTTLGYAWFKHIYKDDLSKGKITHMVLRYILGMAGVMVLWFGLGQIFPRNEDMVSYGLRTVRYALVGAWIAFFAPLLFIKLRLSTYQTTNQEVP